MKRVTGIGGVFFLAKDAPALQAWYKRHLGIDVQAWGGAVLPPRTDANGKTAWQIFPEGHEKFANSKGSFMVNYVVEDLEALVKVLREEGCDVCAEVEDHADFGKFGWVVDPEGNKIDLWQPAAG
jgi:predicted enzyme related to lactoylglutathione lyase